MHANVQQTSSISQTAAEFKSEYETRAVEGNYSIEDVGYFSYDAVWILALALNNTMTMVDSRDMNGTGCENVSGPLVPLEQFNYTNEKMGCLIKWNLHQTNFSGVSVSLYAY